MSSHGDATLRANVVRAPKALRVSLDHRGYNLKLPIPFPKLSVVTYTQL